MQLCLLLLVVLALGIVPDSTAFSPMRSSKDALASPLIYLLSLLGMAAWCSPISVVGIVPARPMFNFIYPGIQRKL